jgi:hypothetical protein
MSADTQPSQSSMSPALQAELQPLVTQIGTTLESLQRLEGIFGDSLARLAALDWQALARQGVLADVPRLAIVRTIGDARNVLANGLQVLTDVLRQVQDPQAWQTLVGRSKQPEVDVPAQLRAMIRLYADTPKDIRNRCERLAGWLTKINQAHAQHGLPPLAVELPEVSQ